MFVVQGKQEQPYICCELVKLPFSSWLQIKLAACMYQGHGLYLQDVTLYLAKLI